MTIRRLNDWPERLHAYLRQHSATPFSWGSHDCARFTAGAVEAITGRDLLPCEWSDKTQATAALRALGGLMSAMDSVLLRLERVGLAWRGDVVMVQAPVLHGGRRHWLAVADGDRWWSPGPSGLVMGRISDAVHAWEVSHG